MTCCLSPEAELKLPHLQKDLPAGLQKEGSQGLLPLPAPYHSSGPTVTPGQATQQADLANDSKTLSWHFSNYGSILCYSNRPIFIFYF